MKLFKSLITYFTLLCFVTACTSTEYKTESETPEVIQAFFIADNTLYAIGQLHSYQFKGNQESYRGKETAKLIQFLQDKPLMQKVIGAKVSRIRQEVGTNKVKVDVSLTLDPKKLSEQEKTQIKVRYEEIDKNNEIDFDIEGNLAQIQNQAEILKNARLVNPLKTTFRTYSTHLEYDAKETEEGLFWGSFVVVMIPLAIIALPFALPFAAVSALTEKAAAE